MTQQHETMSIYQSAFAPIIQQHIPRSGEQMLTEKRRAASRAARMRTARRRALRVYELAGLLMQLSQPASSTSGCCPLCARPLRGKTSIKHGIGRGCRERILSMVEALRRPEQVQLSPDHPEGLQ